jgi:segregation and condensation protein B
MDKNRIAHLISAVLFVTGDPVSVANLAALAGMDFEEFDELLSGIIKEKAERNEGILIRRIADKVQLCTNADYAEYIQLLLAPEVKGRLSNSVLETLSIIAYKQPVTRSEIESIRGVRCDYAVSVLLEKGMISEAGRKDVIGRPVLFATTDEFLRSFGITDLGELPAIDFEKYEQAEEAL